MCLSLVLFRILGGCEFLINDEILNFNRYTDSLFLTNISLKVRILIIYASSFKKALINNYVDLVAHFLSSVSIFHITIVLHQVIQFC